MFKDANARKMPQYPYSRRWDRIDKKHLLYRKIEFKDIKTLCQLYCEEENITCTDDYVERAKLAYTRMSDKGDYILGAFGYMSDRLLGVVSVHHLDDLYPRFTDSPYVHLETIVIRKGFRGAKIGTRLLAAALDANKDATYIIAQTAKDNKAMQKVYEKVGFTRQNINFMISDVLG